MIVTLTPSLQDGEHGWIVRLRGTHQATVARWFADEADARAMRQALVGLTWDAACAVLASGAF